MDSPFSLSPYFPLSSLSQNNNEFLASSLYNYPPSQTSINNNELVITSPTISKRNYSSAAENDSLLIKQSKSSRNVASHAPKARKGGKRAKFDPDYCGPNSSFPSVSNSINNNNPSIPSAPIFGSNDDLWNHLKSKFEPATLQRLSQQMTQEAPANDYRLERYPVSGNSDLLLGADPFSHHLHYESGSESSILSSDGTSPFEEPIIFSPHSSNVSVLFSSETFPFEMNPRNNNHNMVMASMSSTPAYLNEILATPNPANMQQVNAFGAASMQLENRGGIFELKQPLRAKQRKSYEHENRYLTPNPIIAIKESVKERYRDMRIKSGIVSVELVDGSGNTLSPDKQKLLGCSAQGGTHQLLNPYNLSSTRFQLKIFENSRGQSYRLKFYITYITENKKSEQEIIYSNPFQVESNKKKPKPRTTGPNPPAASSAVNAAVAKRLSCGNNAVMTNSISHAVPLNHNGMMIPNPSCSS